MNLKHNTSLNQTHAPDKDKDRVIQFVTFTLAGETYGVDVMQIQEVLRHTEIAPVPGAPSYVIGIINLRGNVVTVIDTRERFELEPGEITDASRIVIIESEKHVVGILVDSVSEVVYMHQSEIENVPNVGGDSTAKFIYGVCHKNETLYMLIDLNKLLTEEEWNDVETN